ncbi:hypothetical protein QFZ73_003046 [Peribacillus sp. V2I11]|nr:hypothetical protein [Peribacillus sp. V2I11]
MKVSSISFKEPPVYHDFPPLYEGLGLPELSSFIQQRFDLHIPWGKSKESGLVAFAFINGRGISKYIYLINYQEWDQKSSGN